MSSLKIFEVKHGVWIEERWLRSAGLGTRLQVSVEPGEIRISKAPPSPSPKKSKKGWDVFKALGNDTSSGRLINVSEKHDDFLYGKTQ